MGEPGDGEDFPIPEQPKVNPHTHGAVAIFFHGVHLLVPIGLLQCLCTTELF